MTKPANDNPADDIDDIDCKPIARIIEVDGVQVLFWTCRNADDPTLHDFNQCVKLKGRDFNFRVFVRDVRQIDVLMRDVNPYHARIILDKCRQLLSEAS